MSKSQITVNLSEGAIPVSRFAPQKPGPLLVIVPSIFGVSPDVVVYGERFAQQGALVYIMDSFWRQAPGPLAIPSQAQAAMARMKALSLDDAYADLLAVIDAGLQDERCSGGLILLGICYGGRLVVRASQDRDTQGVGVWHGAGIGPYIVPAALENTTLSIDFGAADALIPMEEIEQVRHALTGLSATIRVHEQAGHGFTHRNTTQCVKNAADASEAGVLSLIAKVSAQAPVGSDSQP